MTPPKHPEETGHNREAPFRQLVDAVPDAVIIVRQDGTIVRVNTQTERLFGYAREELLGQVVEVLLPERFRRRHHEHRHRYVAAPSLRPMGMGLELSARRKDGTEFPVEISLSPLESQEGVLVFSTVRDITERKQTEGLLRDLSGRLLNAQEDERSRIARDLHDDVHQKLALLAIDLALVGQTPPESSAQLTERIEGLSHQVQELSSVIHNLSHRLHPSTLERLGLVTALESLCTELSSQYDIQLVLTHQSIPRSLPDAIALVLYRVVQECLQNVVKHSAAPAAQVALTGSPHVMRLCVSDGGRGFDPQSVSQSPGLGLISMQERLRAVDGTFAIRSRPARGVQVDVSIPLPPATG